MVLHSASYRGSYMKMAASIGIRRITVRNYKKQEYQMTKLHVEGLFIN